MLFLRSSMLVSISRSTVTNNLYKSVPKFSKTPARKLSLGVVLGCLNSFEH